LDFANAHWAQGPMPMPDDLTEQVVQTKKAMKSEKTAQAWE